MGVTWSVCTRRPYSYRGCKPDRAILMHSEVQNGLPSSAPSCEEIALDINGSSLALNGLRFGYGFPANIDSPSDCTTLSTISNVTATPLDHKYRFHLFFAYCEKDKFWVDNVVRKLESEPMNFRCCYAERDFDDATPTVQNVLCSIMLSQRVVVVLTPSFVTDSWSVYEESITHLTSLSQRRQRVIPVMLEECAIPESLRVTQPIDVSRDASWDGLFQSLTMEGLPYSESLYTVRSLSSPVPGYNNGQLLTRVTARIKGLLKSRLLFDYDEVPDPLTIPDVTMSRQQFAEIIKAVGREEHGQELSWLFSALPTILLAVVFVLWCVAFILVIILFPDNTPSTLPVRLCVFSLPAIFIVVGCVFRWRRVKHKKEKYSMCMFSRSVQVNRHLYVKGKSVIVSTARTHDDHFHIYFIYFNKSECIEQIKLFLTHCTDDDLSKLNKLVDVYTLGTQYLSTHPVAVRLAIMVSSAYAINLLFKRVPHALEQRHTKHRQCLCQFIEEFLAAYLPCIRQEADTNNLRHVFFKYLNCQVKTDPIILHSLGITVIEA